MKRLVFGCILLVDCNHSAGSGASPTGTTTAVIPSSSASSPPESDPGIPSNAKECGIPADWTKMNKDFPYPADELVVLDWRRRADNRPLFIDEAIAWYRGHGDAGAYWFLTTIYRHPKEENEWRLAVVFDAPIVPQMRFDHAPTAANVDAFLKNTTWLERDESFKQSAGKRCDAAWARVIGSPPPRK